MIVGNVKNEGMIKSGNGFVFLPTKNCQSKASVIGRGYNDC